MQLEQSLASYNGNPQIEDGYTKIANELLEAIISYDFTERQYSLLFAVIRKTYGFNKKQDEISLSQLSILTKIPANHVSAVISQLEKINVIIKNKGKFCNQLSLNKSYDLWGVRITSCHKTSLRNVEFASTSVGVLPVRITSPQNTIPKEIPKERLSNDDFENFYNRYPKKEARKKALESWLKNKPNIDLIMKALDWQIPKWKIDNNKFVPLPATYLNGARWEDNNETINADDWRKNIT